MTHLPTDWFVTPMRPPLQLPTTHDIATEQLRHDDVLGWFGEMSAILTYWLSSDYEANRTDRCKRCYRDFGDIASAYGQPADSQCPECYGTTFHGGFSRIHYAPCLWDLTPQSDSVKSRGQVVKVSATVQLPSWINVVDGDLLVRADNTRWRCDQPEWEEITTGFGSQLGNQNHRLRGSVSVQLIDKSDVAYVPYVDLSQLSVTGWKNYVPSAPSSLQVEAPEPVGMPGSGAPMEAIIRGLRWQVKESYYSQYHTDRQDVSAGTFSMAVRDLSGTLLHDVPGDMLLAQAGDITFELSGVQTAALPSAVEVRITANGLPTTPWVKIPVED